MSIYDIIWLVGVLLSFLYFIKYWQIDEYDDDGVTRFFRGLGILFGSVFWPVGWTVFFIIKIGNYQRK